MHEWAAFFSMSLFSLIDVAPPNAGPAGGSTLTVLAVVALLLAATLVLGTIFLIRRIIRRRKLNPKAQAGPPNV